jgi:hypothetical protein
MEIKGIEIDRFTRGYLECALWLSTDDNDNPLDDNYSLDDLTLNAITVAKSECEKFQRDNEELLKLAGDDTQNGHDFWLTRNGHGAGFWDRDYENRVGNGLIVACKNFGEANAYVDDNGEIEIDSHAWTWARINKEKNEANHS